MQKWEGEAILCFSGHKGRKFGKLVEFLQGNVVKSSPIPGNGVLISWFTLGKIVSNFRQVICLLSNLSQILHATHIYIDVHIYVSKMVTLLLFK